MVVYLLFESQLIWVACMVHLVLEPVFVSSTLLVHVFKLLWLILLNINNIVSVALILFLSFHIRRLYILLTRLLIVIIFINIMVIYLLPVINLLPPLSIPPQKLYFVTLFWTWLVLVRLLFVEPNWDCSLVLRFCCVHFFIRLVFFWSFLFKCLNYFTFYNESFIVCLIVLIRFSLLKFIKNAQNKCM